jgi:hypothetical protein
MYRNTPLSNGYSPAQLSMGRRLKTRVPCSPTSLLPALPDTGKLKKNEREYREKMKQNYDRRHRVVEPDEISLGDEVFVPDLQRHGTVVEHHAAPRSIVIQTSDGAAVRRNRQMTRKLHRPSAAGDNTDDSTKHHQVLVDSNARLPARDKRRPERLIEVM